MSSSHRATRACDGCRIRKVKCDGSNPCSQCAHFNISCVVSTPAAKRKNPIRGRLVAQLRGDSGQLPGSSSQLRGVTSNYDWITNTSTSPSTSVSHSNTDNTRFNAYFFTSLVPQFEQLVYPVNPVITTDDICSAIANMDKSLEDRALVHAFGAVTVFLNQTSDTICEDTAMQIDILMQRSLDAHRRVDLSVGPNGRMFEELPVTIKRIMTCIFLEISMMAFKRFDRSFALLREGITMIQTLEMHHFSSESRVLRGIRDFIGRLTSMSGS
ncbi:Fc.00g073780.m01.CDS01 [Cosmosporella sp. VM-42]